MNLKSKKFGLLPQEEDSRDYTARTLGVLSSGNTDLIELTLPPFVYDQGHTDMCSAFSSSMMVTMINSWTDEDGNITFPLEFSQCDIYAQKTTSGEGGQLRDILNQIKNRGISPDVLYNTKGTFEECKEAYAQNKAKADAMAELGRIRFYYSTPTKEDVVAALELGKPVICGINIYENFKPNSDNFIPLPEGSFLGGHAILIVGFKMVDGVPYVKLLNSWGSDWGDNGTAWVPYEMVFSCYVPVDSDMKVKLAQLQIGNKNCYMGGKKYEMDVAPFIVDGRTMVELNIASILLGAELEWLQANKVIFMRK